MSSAKAGGSSCLARFSINEHDGIPIYRQIANQVRYLLASGSVRSGAELPPIRQLAKHLKVAPNTIVKAYDELAMARVIHRRQGAGTYVAKVAAHLAMEECRRGLERRIDALLTEASRLNVTSDHLVQLIGERKGKMAGEIGEGQEIDSTALEKGHRARH
jgi:GntR family transcriptional regulator